MYTIVVYLDKKLYDWYLIEPLFYKVQSLNTITFLDAPIDKTGRIDYKQLEVSLYKLLYEQAIDDWQLVFVLSNSKQDYMKKRVSKILNALKDSVIKPLEIKQIAPTQSAFLMLDPFTREKDNSPIENMEDINWQLDTVGYIFEGKPEFTHNMFTSIEMERLDDAWPNNINLADADLLNKPNQEFLQQLQEKAYKVVDIFQKVLNEKYSLSSTTTLDQSDYILTSREIDIIHDDFLRGIEEIITPPLTKRLEQFKPSSLLKQIVKSRIAIEESVKQFRFIRIPFLTHSSVERTYDLICTALFIHTIAIDPSIIHTVPKGTPVQLDLQLDEVKLKNMLTNHYLSLEEAKKKIEILLLDSMLTNVYPYSEIKVDSVQIKHRKDLQPAIPKWNYQNNTLYTQTWAQEMEKIEENIEEIERRFFSVVQKEALHLTISKRRQLQEKEYDEEVVVEIHTYLKELEDYLEETQLKMSKQSPNHQGVLQKWKEYKEKKRKELLHKFRFFPSNQMVIIAYLFIALSLLVPYYLTVPFKDISAGTFRFWNALILMPSIIMVLSVLLGLFVRKRLRKPIQKLIKEVQQEANEYANALQVMPEDYEAYLKNLYRLFHKRKQYFSLRSHLKEVHRKNVLLRFHQGLLDEKLKNTAKLLQKLKYELSFENREQCKEFVNQQLDATKGILENKVYSPLECLFEKQDTMVEIFIRDASYHSTANGILLVTNITLQKDQVYNI